MHRDFFGALNCGEWAWPVGTVQFSSVADENPPLPFCLAAGRLFGAPFKLLDSPEEATGIPVAAQLAVPTAVTPT